MKKRYILLLIIFSLSFLLSFSENRNVKIRGRVIVAGNGPFIYPVLKSDDDKAYKIFCETREDKSKFYALQGMHLEFKGYVQEDEVIGLVIFPNSWKVIRE